MKIKKSFKIHKKKNKHVYIFDLKRNGRKMETNNT